MSRFVFAKGEPYDYKEAEWRENDDLESIDKEGMPHESYYKNIQLNYNDTKDCLCLKGEPNHDEDAEWRFSDNHDTSHIEGKPHETYYGDSLRNQDDTNHSLLA